MKSPLSPVVADRVGGLPHASPLSPVRYNDDDVDDDDDDDFLLFS